MADKKKVTEKEVLADGSNLLFRGLGEVMHDSMMPYAEHVILDRALPRVEDGLKPVQRRILYTMYELGLTPDKPYLKSARIVGDCMGKYHPHGDSSVYLAMVRMAQDFSMSAVLIDGQGNYGSNDGDSPAAMRYTEARMAPLALELLRDLHKDTVKWSRNYDDKSKEPDMLPGRFPNLLVNGASGIAVGLATNIPPHNLTEAIDGVIAYLNNKNIILSEMMKIIKGPDFPTGGYVIAGELLQAYETGKGKIQIRARVHIERDKNDKQSIVISELPYQVVKSKLLQDILELREAKKDLLGSISDIVDESDKEGMRAVIKIRKDGNPDAILDLLFKHSDLAVSYAINIVAIAGGKPRQMGLLDIISYYSAYQTEVVRNRAQYDLAQAKDREHIILGLITAINNIDEIIAIIRGASNRADAALKLRKRFDLSERQADGILEIKLARLTKLEIISLEDELKETKTLIKSLTAILGDEKLLIETVKNELNEIKKKYKAPRRSVIVGQVADAVVTSDDDVEPVEECMVVLAADYKVKRVLKKNFNMSSKRTLISKPEDVPLINCPASTDQIIYFFTDKGNCFKCGAREIPESKFRESGFPLQSFAAGVLSDEKVVGIFSAAGVDAKTQKDVEFPSFDLLFITRSGLVKRTGFEEYKLNKQYFQAMKLKEGDEIIAVEELKEGSSVLEITKSGMALMFSNTENMPKTGRISAGVAGIKMSENDSLVFGGQISEEGEIIVMTEKGFAKRILNCHFDVANRNLKGARVLEFGATNGNSLIFASNVTTPYNIIVFSDKDAVILSSEDIEIQNRSSKGKQIKELKGLSIAGVHRDIL